MNPEGHYVNAMTIYTALKRSLEQKYYGGGTKKKHKKYLDDDEKIEDVSFKGTPFHNCEIPYEVFNISRRTKIIIKQ